MDVPLAVIAGVIGSTEAQVTGPEVGAGAAVQAGPPHTLVNVLAATPSQPATLATTDGDMEA